MVVELGTIVFKYQRGMLGTILSFQKEERTTLKELVVNIGKVAAGLRT